MAKELRETELIESIEAVVFIYPAANDVSSNEPVTFAFSILFGQVQGYFVVIGKAI